MTRLLNWLSKWSLRWTLGVSLAIWSVLLGSLLAVTISQSNDMAVALAAADGRTSINKDLTYRQWASQHGGVYVPASPATPPNPYLGQVPERDIVTPSGRPLTLVNPAYMTRQVHELAARQFGVRSHITSLKPIRPGNDPLDWERQALEGFEHGSREFLGVATESGSPVLHVMRPMAVEASCMKCHAAQGYHVGDIRGGISVTVPLGEYYAASGTHVRGESAFYGLIWILGVAALGLIGQATKLRRQERAADRSALVASESRYHDLFTSMTEGFAVHEMIWDADEKPVDFRFLEVNPAFERLTEMKAELLLGRTAREVLPAFDAFWVEKCGEVVKTGTPGQFEDYVPTLGRHLTITVFPTQADQFAVVMNDVTARVDAERTIKEQADLLDVTQDAIAVSAIDGTLQWVNRGFERLSGWTRAEVIGKNASAVLFPDGQPSSFRGLLGRVLSHGEASAEFEFIGKDRRRFTAVTSWTLLRAPDGEPKSLLVVGTDVSEQRRLEAQILRTQRLESLGVMASGIAHDLNNVLSPIMIAAPSLRERVTDSDDLDLIGTIEASAARGAAVVRQILTFARGISGERGPVNVPKIVSETEYFLKETLPRSIELSVSVPPGLWTVIGDATQVQQVLMNLCVNARDAMPTGGSLRLACRNFTLESPLEDTEPIIPAGRYVAVQVADTGTGMAEDVLARIFEPFYTTKPTGMGTGLGLSTVLGIARSHGGGVAVRSQVGIGTTFIVYLPAQFESAAEKPAAVAPAAPSGAGELVLVADDEGLIRNLVERGLKRGGYRVMTARNGEEATVMYREHRDEISLVLTDYSMPVMDGGQLAATIRDIDAHLPVIIMSGLGETMADELAARLRVSAIVVKPFVIAELLQVVARLLDKPRA